MSNQDESPGHVRMPPSSVEDFVNRITHGAGLVLSIVGAIVLVVCAASLGDVWRVVGCSVYAMALVAVYTASTLSHSFSSPRMRHLFRILDQGFIYLLIAGTYTPFALAFLRHGWWWLLLGAIWTIAIFGFLSKILFAHRVEAVSIWIYLLLGWMPCIASMPLMETVPASALWWIVIGGLCYTIGTVFLIFDEKVFHFHAVWHLFVIAGSTCHFLAILFFVARVA